MKDSTEFNQKLAENLNKGRKACDYAREIIQSSPSSLLSLLNHRDLTKKEKNELLQATRRLKTLRKKALLNEGTCLKILFCIPDIRDDGTVFELTKNLALVKEYATGNCEEYSSLALNYLRETGVSRAEYAGIEEGDHCIVIIDREADSDINNPSTWGSTVVVCDPWSGRTFPASAILENLQCLEEGTAILCDYNPNHHHFVSAFSVGGIDNSAKMRALHEAKVKLEIIKTSNPHDTDKIDQIIRNLSEEFDAEESTMALEQRLTAIVHQYLDRVPDTKKSRQKLIEGWLVHQHDYYDESGEPSDSLLIAFCHIIIYYDPSVSVLILQNLDQSFVNILIQCWKPFEDLLNKGNTPLFLELLSKIDDESIEMVLLRKAASLLRLAEEEGLINCVNALNQKLIDYHQRKSTQSSLIHLSKFTSRKSKSKASETSENLKIPQEKRPPS